jgi:YNFM family putative membrane transporter
VFGSLAGPAWHAALWPGVVALSIALLAVSGILAMLLRRVPTLVAGQR